MQLHLDYQHAIFLGDSAASLSTHPSFKRCGCSITVCSPLLECKGALHKFPDAPWDTGPCLLCPALAALAECGLLSGPHREAAPPAPGRDCNGDCQQCETRGWLLLLSLWGLTVSNFFAFSMLLFRADAFISKVPLWLLGYRSNQLMVIFLLIGIVIQAF